MATSPRPFADQRFSGISSNAGRKWEKVTTHDFLSCSEGELIQWSIRGEATVDWWAVSPSQKNACSSANHPLNHREKRENVNQKPQLWEASHGKIDFFLSDSYTHSADQPAIINLAPWCPGDAPRIPRPTGLRKLNRSNETTSSLSKTCWFLGIRIPEC